MKGLFCHGCKAKKNEEYRVILKRRAQKLYFLLLVGIATAILGVSAYLLMDAGLSDFQLGVVSGAGIGLTMGAVISLIRIYGILHNEEKLKEQRLKETDERELEVSNRALKATAKIMLAALYVMMLIGVFFNETLVFASAILIFLFLLCYIICTKYIEKMM